MATEPDVKRLAPVELVASVRGFYQGAMVEPGESFMFDPNPSIPGGKVKWPKWAAQKGKEAVKQSKDELPFDTRPVAAQAAAARKQKGVGAV